MKNQKKKQIRGFAAMSTSMQKRITSMGGKRAWELGVAHKFTKEEAKLAGLKGGRPRLGVKKK